MIMKLTHIPLQCHSHAREMVFEQQDHLCKAGSSAISHRGKSVLRPIQAEEADWKRLLLSQCVNMLDACVSDGSNACWTLGCR